MKAVVPVVVVGGLASVVIWGASIRDALTNAPAPRKVSPEVEARVRAQLAREERVNNVSISKTIWHKSGFGTVMVATFKVRNGNAVPVKDIVVSCDQYGPSGTLISTATKTIYRELPPKAETTIENFNMGVRSHPIRDSRLQGE